MKPEERLKQLGITLNDPPCPAANYMPAIKTCNLIFISGQSCFINGKPKYTGKVGRELSLEEGYEAARITAINCLAVLHSEIGILDRVSRIIKVFGLVNSAPGFNRQPQVINGASDFFVEIFGEQGRHARSAVGANELPFDIPVEIEMIVEIKD